MYSTPSNLQDAFKASGLTANTTIPSTGFDTDAVTFLNATLDGIGECQWTVSAVSGEKSVHLSLLQVQGHLLCMCHVIAHVLVHSSCECHAQQWYCHVQLVLACLHDMGLSIVTCNAF